MQAPGIGQLTYISSVIFRYSAY